MSQTTQTLPARRGRTVGRRGAGFAVVVAAATLGVVLASKWPVGAWLIEVVRWARATGATGAFAYAAVYVAATVLMLPASVLTIGAGFVYGPVIATLVVSPASVLGATAAFLLARTVARAWVARRVARDARLAAIDAAVATEGFKIVMLLRLSPVVPFNLLNYAVGLSRVRLRDFALASFLGMLPGTLLYVYVGSLVTNASDLLRGAPGGAGPWVRALYWGGLVATVAATALVTRASRRALRRALAARGDPGVVPVAAVRP